MLQRRTGVCTGILASHGTRDRGTAWEWQNSPNRCTRRHHRAAQRSMNAAGRSIQRTAASPWKHLQLRWCTGLSGGAGQTCIEGLSEAIRECLDDIEMGIDGLHMLVGDLESEQAQVIADQLRVVRIEAVH